MESLFVHIDPLDTEGVDNFVHSIYNQLLKSAWQSKRLPYGEPSKRRAWANDLIRQKFGPETADDVSDLDSIRALLFTGLLKVEPRKREILEMRNSSQPMTLKGISKLSRGENAVTPERIRQLEEKGLDELRYSIARLISVEFVSAGVNPYADSSSFSSQIGLENLESEGE